MVLLPFMFPRPIHQSCVHVRSRSDYVINLTYDIIAPGVMSPSLSTMRRKCSAKMHQNTSFCAEFNGEHAGEGFMPLLVGMWMPSFADMDA